MVKIQNFTDLHAWKEAHSLTIVIYKITKNFPKEEIFGLTSQLRRASVSIESCIAEGFSRYHFKDRLNFYYDARGSVSEVQSQSITARDLGYFSNDIFQDIFDRTNILGKILNGLIRSTGELVIKRKH